MAGGVPGTQQGGRPGSALPVPLGSEGCNFALPWSATPARACIGIASCRVPAAARVTPSAFYMEKPPQYPGPTPDTTAPAAVALTASAVVTVRPLISLASEATTVLCPASPCTESSSAFLGPTSALTAPELTPAQLESYLLLVVARATASTIQRAPCLKSSLAGKQRPNLSPPQFTANHLELPLLK